MSGRIYKFKFLGSVTECKYEGAHNSRNLKEVGEPEPFIFEFRIAAYSKERAEAKLRRFIAWNFEKDHRMSNYGD